MKNKFLKIITLGFISLVAGAMFCACGKGDTEKKYDHLVTFNYNVGSLGTAIENQYLGVKDGSLVAIKPGHSNDYKEGVLNGYYIEGWYTAKTDDNGNVIVGQDGRVVLDKKWDFEKNQVEENVVLYANFVQRASLVFKGGDVDWKEDTYDPGSIMRQPHATLAPTKAGYTLVGYYQDEECTIPFEWPYQFQAGVHTVGYVKFIEGTWSIVETAQEFKDALTTGKNIYLMKDIEFTDSVKWAVGVSYNGEIAGNNHKVSGISGSLSATKNDQSNFGMFGTLGATANIHDITFENVQLSFTDGGFTVINNKAALFAWKTEAGTKLTNVTITGTLTQKSVIDESDVSYEKFIAYKNTDTVTTNCVYDTVVIP